MRSRTLERFGLPALILLAAATEPALGITLLAPVSYREWKMTNRSSTVTASQWVAPLRITQPLSQRVDLILQAALESGINDELKSARISGETDTRTEILLHLNENRWLIRTTLDIPKESRSLSPEQVWTALTLAPPFLGYRVRQTGAGIEGAITTSYAFSLTPGWTMGIGGGYVYQGRYRPDDLPEVLPGPEYDLSAGVDGHLGAIDVRIDVARRIHGEDGGGTGYVDPPSWEGSLRASAAGTVWSSGVNLLFCDKAPAVRGATPLSGRYSAGSFYSLRRVGPAVWLGIGGEAVQFTSFGPSPAAGPTSWTAGGGPRLVVPIGRGFRIGGRLYRLAGTLRDGGSSDLSGWAAQLSLSHSM